MNKSDIINEVVKKLKEDIYIKDERAEGLLNQKVLNQIISLIFSLVKDLRGDGYEEDEAKKIIIKIIKSYIRA